MLRSIFGKTIWERRTGLVWWVLGVAALAMLTVAFWPTLRDQPDLSEFLESLPPGLLALFGGSDVDVLFTPAGFVSSRLYASIGPILLIVFAISVGTRVVAGEEDRGTMDLLLSQPVTRTRIVIEGLGAMVLLVAVLAATLLGVLLATNPLFDLELTVTAVLAANVGVMLLAILHGALALAIGGLTGNRAITLGAATAVVVFGWFINGLAEVVKELEPAQQVSPFHWFLQGAPLSNGFDWPANILMAAVAAAFSAIAVWGFNRRDVAT
jgi:ABC-2 type transport system permease protein